MTASEIADWLDALVVDEVDYEERIIHKAAATIRAQAEALKIATEALEPFAEAVEDLPDGARCTYSLWESSAAMGLEAQDLRRAAKALARMKEVG